MSVTTRLLATKLFIPQPCPALVPRPRLYARLDSGMQRRLTLISALPGSGKTTLLSEWQAAPGDERFPLAWVSLDEADNDPTRFWSYVIEALETLFPTIGEDTLPLLNVFPSPPIESILTALINALSTATPPEAQGRRDDFALVLDDYYTIEAQPIHAAMTFLLDHLPPHMHVIIATRTDPPLPLARLRARGQLLELRTEDLRFTLDETMDFLKQTMELSLSVDESALLATRTEGWIAGLQLAALSLQGQEDASSFTRTFGGDHRYIFDYLAQEVLEQQPQHVQEFLLQTAILHRLTADLCNAVTGQPDSQVLLSYLEKANLFLVALDHEGQWYRYHALFSEFLLSLLKRTRPTAYINELHRRAASWHAQHDLVHFAVHHLIETEDFEQAADLIEQTARKVWMRGETMTLQCWIADLPHELVHARPQLHLFHVWSLIAEDRMDEAEKHLDEVERRLQVMMNPAQGTSGNESTTSIPDFAHIRSELMILRATIARFRGDAPRTVELSNLALASLPQDDLVLRSITALNLGHAYRLGGNVPAGSEAFQESISLGRAVDNAYTVLLAFNHLIALQIVGGSLHQAFDLCQQALQFASMHGCQQLPLMSLAHIRLAELFYEWNELEAAFLQLAQAIKLAQQDSTTKYPIQCYLVQAMVHQAQGKAERALETIGQASALVKKISSSSLLPLVAATQARLWFMNGKHAAAYRWLKESGLNINDKPDYLREVEYLAMVRLMIAQGKARNVLGLLEHMRQAAQAGGRMRSVIEILLLQAMANYAQGQFTQAFTALERALSVAEAEDHTRLFADEGRAFALLLAKWRSWKEEQQVKGTESIVAETYLDKLLSVMGQQNAQNTSTSFQASHNGRVPPLMEALGERELEVLRYLAAGLSNQAISEAMVVALSTVKSHLKSIYRKLDVDSRTQAVARARELRLL